MNTSYADYTIDNVKNTITGGKINQLLVKLQ